jgi:3-phosphoshikimate 1-carboxyvinyltransferase
MRRVAEPLRMRGAVISGRPHPKKLGDIAAPLDIGPLPPGHCLNGVQYAMPTSSAQVKSALLLSGLFASGQTVITEPVRSRDHTERMLLAMGANLQIVGATVRLEPPDRPDALPAFDVRLAGDFSAAAFPMVAAALVEGSSVTIKQTGLNPSRTGLLDILQSFGTQLVVTPGDNVLNEPVGEVAVRNQPLRAAHVGGEIATRAIDEIPIACALAARARGTTEFADVAELRVKESDRLATMAETLHAFGVQCEERPNGLVIQGRPQGRLRGARVASHGDHRIAMTAAVLALTADGPTDIYDSDCIATSFPNFIATLGELGAKAEVLP